MGASETIKLILAGDNRLPPVLRAGQNSVKQFADGTIGHFRRIAGSVLNLQNAIVGAAAAMAAKSLFKPATDMENYITQMRSLKGSTEQATLAIAKLMDFSDVTPFEPDPVVRAGIILERFTRGAEDTIDMVRLVGDAAANTGSDFGELGGWIGRAYAMIKGGEPIGEATRRLLELGVITPDVKSRLAQLQATAADGSEVWAVLRQALEQHTGAMERLSKTTSGRISTLVGKWQGLKRDIADDALPAVNQALGDLIGEIDKLRSSGTLDQWGRETGAAILTVWEHAKTLAAFIRDNRETLETLGISYVVFTVLKSAAASITTLTLTVRALAVAETQAAAAGTTNTAAIAAQGAAASSAATSMGLMKSTLMGLGSTAVLAGISGLVAEIYQIKRASDDVNEALDRIGAAGKRENPWVQTAKAILDIAPGMRLYRAITGGPSGEVADYGGTTDEQLKAAIEARAKRNPADDTPAGVPDPTAAADTKQDLREQAAKALQADIKAEIADRQSTAEQLADAEKDLADEQQRLRDRANTDSIQADIERTNNRINAARELASKEQAVAQDLAGQADDAWAKLLEPRNRANERDQARAEREDARLHAKLSKLQERFTLDPETGQWTDRDRRTANRRETAILQAGDLRAQAASAAIRANGATAVADTSQQQLVALQGQLRDTTADNTDATAELTAKISELTEQLINPTGTGPLGGYSETALAAMLSTVGGIIPASPADLAKDALLSQLTSAGAPLIAALDPASIGQLQTQTSLLQTIADNLRGPR